MQSFTTTALVLLTMAAPALAASGFCYDVNECGPDAWGALDIDDNQCDGLNNSPIAIDDEGCTMYLDYEFTPGDCGDASQMVYTIDDHVVKAAYPEGCQLNEMMIPVIGGPYAALQLHIHMFSEHTIDDEHYGAELHIVHAEVNGGRFAVAGMMISPTSLEPHPVFQELLDGWQTVADATTASCARRNLGQVQDEPVTRRVQSTSNFNAYDLLPEGTGFYHYDGGLTTPPCSEVVWWNLADTPLQVSVAQFVHLGNLILNFVDADSCEAATVASVGGSTSRPPQPLNGRIVDRICPTSAMPEDANKGKASKGKKGGKMAKKEKVKKNKKKKSKDDRRDLAAGVRGAN